MTGVSRDDDGFTVPAEIIATAFGLTEQETAERMRRGEITSRTEEGVGDDAGRWRLSFTHAGKTFRLTVDAAGTILSRARFDARRVASKGRDMPRIGTGDDGER